MNKQEVIEKIKRRSDYFSSEKDYDRGYRAGLDSTLLILRELDEPEKPVVPQFVADWYEENKDDFENNLFMYCINWDSRDKSNFAVWFKLNDNKPIQTLINMHQFGYEVKKEKLYTVELPNPNRADVSLVLGLYNDGKVAVFAVYTDNWKYEERYKLTEAEIKKDFDWAWQFAKEVKE